MKRILIALAAAFVLVGAGNGLDFQPAVDTDFDIQRECNPLCWELYTDLVTGNVRYRGYDSDSIHEGSIIFDQAADSVQIATYAEYLVRTEKHKAAASLNSEVENGKKIVELLIEWSVTYAGYYEVWPTLSPEQKDNAMREHLRHFSVLLSKQADLYVVSDQGR